MVRDLQKYTVEMTAVFIGLLVAYLIFFTSGLNESITFPNSLLIYNTIFLSILIEAIPFVLIGVFISGQIQVFVTEDHIQRLIPKNRFLAIISVCLIGALFPACECGIVVIVRRLIGKGVPIYAAVGFLLTGPLINPIVIGSTYMAFGNNIHMAMYRMIIGFMIAMVIAILVSIFFRGNQLRITSRDLSIKTNVVKQPLWSRLKSTLHHSTDEFFAVMKFLIMGALLASFVQTYISTGALLNISDNVATSTGVMMGLSFLLSQCSEADAFIAASFSHLFPTTPLLGFLILGPMLDLKNTFMLMGAFKFKFVLFLLFIIPITVFGMLMTIQVFL